MDGRHLHIHGYGTHPAVDHRIIECVATRAFSAHLIVRFTFLLHSPQQPCSHVVSSSSPQTTPSLHSPPAITRDTSRLNNILCELNAIRSEQEVTTIVKP